jgi:membrane protein implicated in regulation of membrane protease activity
LIDPENTLWSLLVFACISLIVRMVLRRRAERANRQRAERSLKEYLSRDVQQ